MLFLDHFKYERRKTQNYLKKMCMNIVFFEKITMKTLENFF